MDHFYRVYKYNLLTCTKKCFILLLIITLCPFILFGKSNNIHSQKNITKLNLPVDSTTDYLCYYGSWDADKIFRAQDFKLVILEPSNITAAQILQIKKGHDGILGTNDDVIILGYLSLGEDNSGTRAGNGKGPCYYRYDSSKVVYENKGYASWYVDDKDKNGLPDENSNWGSYYVNAGDSLWWQFLKTNPAGADNTLVVKDCDGLFLDTIDTASPWSPWPYRWEVIGMSKLVQWLRQTYPDKYLVANRGLFYFDSTLTQAYANTIRPYIDGDMFESYYLEGDRVTWAKKINKEAQKSDGFKVIALDYFNPTQTSSITQQIKEVFSYNWADYISSSSLNEIRYDVFHRHYFDHNPPTWNSSIGLISALVSNKSVKLSWGALTDQSLPMQFNIYYTTGSTLDISSANELKNVNAVYDTVARSYSYTVNNLTNYQTYKFMVRVQDSAGNSELNVKILTVTPPSGSSSAISIDGNFGDWLGIPKLNSPPNPEATSGDSKDSNADFINFWAINDETNLYLSYQVAGIISSNYFYHIYIDADSNRNTGYIYNDSASIGADFMVENDGFWKYSGSGGSNWSWTGISGFSKANKNGRTEMSIPLYAIFQSITNNQVRMILQVNQNTAPYNQMDVEPDDYKNSYFKYTLNETTIAGVKDEKIPKIEFRLSQNYPNPFNPSTVIDYKISSTSLVNLSIYNVLGEMVATLVNREEPAGQYSILFNPASYKTQLSSGIYFYRLQAGRFHKTKKMIFLK